jgi:hypothetical protein
MLQHHFGWATLLHYLNDFLNIIAGYLPNAQVQADTFGSQFDDLCTKLVFEVRHKKSKTGTTTDFLGLEIDTILMEARLPAEKWLKAMELVNSFLKRKKLSQHELQSIVGFLSFAAKVVLLGRPFLRQLYNGFARNHSPVRVSADMKADLRWWKEFLAQWSGITLIRPCHEVAFIWTDAAGTKGIGG